MEPTRELIDELYRERVLRARRTPPEEKILSGAELFEEACERMAVGIRMDYPDADEAQVRAILARRLALRERMEGCRIARGDAPDADS
jgi:hypothetical protein